jgi:hypothetical protein
MGLEGGSIRSEKHRRIGEIVKRRQSRPLFRYILGNKKRFENIKAFGPEFFVMTHPFEPGMHRPHIEPAHMHPSLHLSLHEPGALHNLYIFGSRGKRNIERLGELADLPLAASQTHQHCPPRWIGQGVKD